MNQLADLFFAQVIERRHSGSGQSGPDDARKAIVVQASEHSLIEQAGGTPA